MAPKKRNVFTGGTEKDVNQIKAESMKDKGRRLKNNKGDLVAIGSMIAGGPAAKVVQKVLPKIVKGAKRLASTTVGKTEKRTNKSEYTRDKKTGKIDTIPNRTRDIGKGIRGSVKTGTGAAGLALVGGNKPKDKIKKKNVQTPKPRPSSIKPKKKEQFMKESSGLRKDDNKKLKDSKVKFKSEVIKRKK